MSRTLSNGYKLPEKGDLGSSWFPDLEFDIQRLNDHTHNGQDSNKLTIVSISVITQILSAGDFAIPEAPNDNVWRAEVECPAGVEIDKTNISFRDVTTKEKMYLKTEKIDETNFYVYSMFNINTEIVYG
jgi:hypothetical protein